ncbi:hypothetical protein AB0N81_38945 [Streptomyces sp. NPDC093510]|uniref:hypothetical protein n=1 Tax=Streptomyces sp. NPDC093510 TaxID=3155199 RepID=UPI00344731ED
MSRGRAGAAERRPTCATEDRADFPIDTRIHRGPDTYRPGGDHQDWTVDLTNTTDEACGNIHPLLVLVDEERTLTPRQVELEFDDGTRRRAVPFEKTGQGENIGVFDDGFAGFTVEPGRTVTVKVRLAFAPGTDPNHVVVSAALVQRRDDDGDWVGSSNDYPFDIASGAEAEAEAEAEDTEPDGTSTTGPDGAGEAGEANGSVGAAGNPDSDEMPAADQLAETGSDGLLRPGLTAGAVLLGVGALALGARRLRAGRR